jgi:hypothetical protein
MKATDHELQKYDIFTRYGQRSPLPDTAVMAPTKADLPILIEWQ